MSRVRPGGVARPLGWRDAGSTTVAAAVARLDLPAIEAARWFGAKGRRSTGVDLDEAFVLDAVAPHVLAVVTIHDRGRERQRYQVALTGHAAPAGRAGRRRVAGARRGHGRGPDHRGAAGPRRGGQPRRPRWSAGPVRRWSPASRTPRSATSGRTRATPRVVLGETILLKAYRRLQPGPQPGPRDDRVPERGGRLHGRAAAGRLRRARRGRRRHDHAGHGPGVRRRRPGRLRGGGRGADRLAAGPGRGQPGGGDRDRRRPGHVDGRAARGRRRRPRPARHGPATGDPRGGPGLGHDARHANLARAPGRRAAGPPSRRRPCATWRRASTRP